MSANFSPPVWLTTDHSTYTAFVAGNIRYNGNGMMEVYDGYSWHLVSSNPSLYVSPELTNMVGLFSENKEAFTEMVKYFSVIASAEKMKEEIPAVGGCLKELNRAVEELKTLIGLCK